MNQTDPNAARNWWVLAILATVAYGMGVWGFYLNLQAVSGTIFDAAYRTFLLFRMKYEGIGAIPWQLELARFLAPFVTMAAIGKIAFSFLREQWGEFRVKYFWSNHNVVIGSCQAGRMLATDIAKRRNRVVFVSDASEDFIGEAFRNKFVVVLRRSKCDYALWSTVRLGHAATLTFIADDDEFNLDGVGQSRSWCEQNRLADSKPLKIFSRFTDHRIRKLLQDHTNFLVPTPHVAVNAFNPYQQAARIILQSYPVEGNYCPVGHQPHALVTGSGPMAENLLFWIASTCHFANDRKTRITFIDQRAEDFFRQLRRRFPGIEDLIEVNVICDDPENPEKTSFAAAASVPITRLYFCSNSGSGNLAAANRWASAVGSCSSVVTFETHGQLAELLQLQNRKGTHETSKSRGKIVFEILDKTCTQDSIMREELDLFAQRAANRYYKKATTGVNSQSRGDTPALYPWAELSEEWRDANRTQIDHIGIKLRTVGAMVVELVDSDSNFSFSTQEIELLARMEHARWFAQRTLSGWEFAQMRNDAMRQHHSMVGWEALTEKERDKDRDAVRSIKEDLALVHKGMKRLASVLSKDE